MQRQVIGLIGASWRGEYYLRIARELPEHFQVRSVLVRTEETATRVRGKWEVPATVDFAEFLASGPYDFVVVAVPRDAAGELLVELARRDIPALIETPPAGDLPGLRQLYSTLSGARIQVAEQYVYQPQHAARLALARSGALGEVHTAEVSVAHDYHGVALIRAALGVGFDEVEISAMSFEDRVVSPRGRDEWNVSLDERPTSRTVAWLDFGGPRGCYDFTSEQYTSPIRSRHLALRGTHGELVDNNARFVQSPGRATALALTRESTGLDGDLEGYFLQRIWAGDRVLFDAQFPGARLNDDELAVAEVMRRMGVFADGGPEFYGLAEGCHDHYLGLLVADAARSGSKVRSEPQPWTTARTGSSI